MPIRRSHRRPRATWRTKVAWTLRLGLIGICLLLVGLTLVPSLLGYQRYVITGISMTGTIDKGSIVYDKVVPVSQLHVGDVITYNPPPGSTATGHLVTHRIVSMAKGDDGRTIYRTKGDHNGVADTWVFHLDDPTQARVAFHIPDAGYLLAALSVRAIRMTIVGVLAALIVLRVAVALWAEAGADERARRRAAKRATREAAAAAATEAAGSVKAAQTSESSAAADVDVAAAAALAARVASQAAASSSRDLTLDRLDDPRGAPGGPATSGSAAEGRLAAS